MFLWKRACACLGVSVHACRKQHECVFIAAAAVNHASTVSTHQQKPKSAPLNVTAFISVQSWIHFLSRSCIDDGRVGLLRKVFSSTSQRFSMGLQSGLCGDQSMFEKWCVMLPESLMEKPGHSVYSGRWVATQDHYTAPQARMVCTRHEGCINLEQWFIRPHDLLPLLQSPIFTLPIELKPMFSD